MKTEDIARIVAEVMGFIIAIVFTMELMNQEVITPVQDAVQVIQAERSGLSYVNKDKMVSKEETIMNENPNPPAMLGRIE